MSEVRAIESDTAVRDADFRGVIAFLLIRHGALMSATPDNPMRATFERSRKSAEDELVWRYELAAKGKPSGSGLKHLIRAIGSIGLALDADYVLPGEDHKIEEIVLTALHGSTSSDKKERES